jgi:hypothetical protein
VSGQIASWDAAVFRSGSISPQVARYAYDLGNISFANSWVATGAVGLCAGLVMLRAPGLPRWAAWWGLLAGAGEVLARAWFRHGFAYAPFASTGRGSWPCRSCWWLGVSRPRKPGPDRPDHRPRPSPAVRRAR